jgi:hypothetical protein
VASSVMGDDVTGLGFPTCDAVDALTFSSLGHCLPSFNAVARAVRGLWVAPEYRGRRRENPAQVPRAGSREPSRTKRNTPLRAPLGQHMSAEDVSWTVRSHIVEIKCGHFEPEKFEDHYEDALKGS